MLCNSLSITLQKLSSCITLIRCANSLGNPCLKIFHNLLRSKLSNSFVKSTNLMYSGLLTNVSEDKHLLDRSSFHPEYRLFTSQQCLVSMLSLIHSMTTLPRTFLGIESNLGDSPEIVAFSQITRLGYFNNHSLLLIICHLHILTHMLAMYANILQQLLDRLLAITEDCWRLSSKI